MYDNVIYKTYIFVLHLHFFHRAPKTEDSNKTAFVRLMEWLWKAPRSSKDGGWLLREPTLAPRSSKDGGWLLREPTQWLEGFNTSRTSLLAQLAKSLPAIQKTPVWSWIRKIHWLPTPVFLGFPGGSVGKESACKAGDMGIPGLERSPGEGKGYSLQYSGLENSMDCIAHGVTKSWTELSDFYLARPPGKRESWEIEFHYQWPMI